MNRQGIALVVLLPLAMTANASEYGEVLRKADGMQRALGPEQKIGLSKATTGEMKAVMNVCEEEVGKMPPGMGVVFEIDADGAVTQTWTRNSTDYEQCFAETMAARIDYEPPEAPFYASMDYGR
ncbi:MAG: hypothetical protein WD382_11660 [Halofilum sp. (in: g-proteobacteria)]